MVDLDKHRASENDGGGRRVVTFAEHLTPPLVTYVFRKVFLGLVLVSLGVLRRVSSVYGFDFEGSVSDREAWCWNVRDKLPRYRAEVEKID